MDRRSFAGKIYARLPNQLQKVVDEKIKGRVPISLFLLYTGGGLRSRGWYQSRKLGMPVNSHQDPIPWMNYSVISFMDRRLRSSHRLFEYGCGNSTKWFADRVDEVVSIEDSQEWVDIIKPQLPPNAQVVLKETKHAYIEEIKNHRQFDIVLVDGKWRNESLKYATTSLTDGGVLILDDAQRSEYAPMKEKLESDGFSSITFSGMKPINRYEYETTIFYREDNVLGI
jgi:hypothetical protein